MANDVELTVKIASGGVAQTVRDVAKVQEALAKMGKSAKDTATLAQQLGKAFDLDPSEVEELAKALGEVKDETEKATEATGQYVDANGRLREANGRFVKGATQGMKDVANQTNVAAKEASALDKVFTGFFESIGRKGLDVAIGLFQSLGGAIQNTVAQANQEFGAFDQALTQFSAKSGIARNELQALEEESVRLAAVTSQTPATVAATAEALLALGATAEQAQERLNGIVTLADLINEDPVLTGKVIQTSLNIFGEFGETADGVADKVNKLINTTAAGSSQGAQEFLQLFQTAGAPAKALGVQLDELGTAFAVLRDNGFSAEVAATGLKTAMLRVGGPTGAAAAELKKLGVEAFDAQGNFLGLENTIRQLREQTINLTQEERIGAINKIFGAEGVPAVLALMDQVDTRFQEVKANVDDAAGSAAESLEILNQSVERQALLLEGNLSGAYTKLGEAIAPIRQSLLEFANSLLATTLEGSAGLDELRAASERFGVALSENPETVQKLADAINVLADAAIQQISLLIDAVTAAISEQQNIDAVTASVEALADVIVRLGQAARFIVALTEGLVTLKKRVDELPPSAQAFKQSLDVTGATKGLELLTSTIKVLQGAFNLLNQTVDSTKNFIQNLVERFDFLANNPVIKALLGQILQADQAAVGLGGSLSQSATAGAAALGTLGDAAATIVDDLEAGEGAGDGLTDGLEEDVEAAVTALERLEKANKNALNTLNTDSANARAELLENGGTQAELAALEQKTLNDRLTQNRTFLQQLKDLQAQGGLDKEDAEKVANEIRGVDAQLANDRVSLAQAVLSEKRRAEQEAARVAEEAAKRQTDALKEARDEAKRLAEESFGDAQKSEGVIFSDSQKSQAEAFQSAQQADQEAFNEAQQSAAKAFQSSQQADEKSFNDGQQAAAKAFQKGQQAEAKAFQQSQQAAAKAFQKSFDAEREKGGREFDVLTSEVERRVQIQQAANEEERRALQQQFREEDKQLEQRRKIEKEVLAERGRILGQREEETQLGPLEQARADFEERLNAKAEAFQANQQAAADAFQAEQQIKAEEFEMAQRAAKETFDAEQKLADETFQEEQRAAAKSFEDEQRAADKAFRSEQQEAERAFQAQQQEAERAFKEQQRQLDKANAEQIARILEAAKPRAIDGARRDGGPVRPGGTYLVGEDGPELVTPRRGGYVYTAQQTAALMASVPSVRGINVPAVGNTKAIEAKLDRLIKVAESSRQVRPQSTYNLTTAAPVQDAMALQLAEIRALVQRRGL